MSKKLFILSLHCFLLTKQLLYSQDLDSLLHNKRVYDAFNRVNQSQMKDINQRLDALDVTYDAGMNSYSYERSGETFQFQNPDFSFMQFRSNLVFRWEYKLGSTLYCLVARPLRMGIRIYPHWRYCWRHVWHQGE